MTEGYVKRLQGRLGAYAQHSRHDVRETTKAARAAFEQRFIDDVDPERKLPEAERQKRAGYARQAYFTRLSLAGVMARRKNAGKEKPTRGKRGPVARAGERDSDTSTAAT